MRPGERPACCAVVKDRSVPGDGVVTRRTVGGGERRSG